MASMSLLCGVAAFFPGHLRLSPVPARWSKLRLSLLFNSPQIDLDLAARRAYP
jgi:hypothetical protein